MRDIALTAVALAVVMAALIAALYFGNDPPEPRPLRNAYWPFSVELAVRDP